MAGSTDGCPFRDIARAIPAATKDDGLNPNEQLDLHVRTAIPGGRKLWWPIPAMMTTRCSRN
jgi:hypothetical protein